MIIVSPEEFKTAYLDAIGKKEVEIVSKWKSSPTAFTNVMRSLFDDIAKTLRLELYNKDYYTLDAIFYEEKDLDYFPADSTYAKYIAVALEHENRLNGSESEMNKLQLFNAPLKVLITYAKEEKKINFLDKYSRIIKGADIFNDIAYTRKQLVVFGSLEGSKTKWSFHVFDSGSFSTI